MCMAHEECPLGRHHPQRTATPPVPWRWLIRRERVRDAASAPWLRAPFSCQRVAQCASPCNGSEQPSLSRGSAAAPRVAAGPSRVPARARGASRSPCAKMGWKPEPAAGAEEPRQSARPGSGLPGAAPPSSHPSPTRAPRHGRRLPWEGSARRRPARSYGQLGPGRARRPPSLSRSLARWPLQSPRPGRGPRCCPRSEEGLAAAQRAPWKTFTFPEPGSTGQLLGTAF